jgi:hypothetical protein
MTVPPAVADRSIAEEMLLDDHLPDYDVTERHAVIVDAAVDRTWRAVRTVDLFGSPVIAGLGAVRGLPARLRGLRAGPAADPHGSLSLDDMLRRSFLLLDERPGEEIVLGSVARPWKAVPRGGPRPDVDAVRFAGFDAPGYAKIAFNIRVTPYGRGRSLVTTETRVAVTDDASRRLFARYWLVIGPFSALIRRLMLRNVRSAAEGGPAEAASPR